MTSHNNNGDLKRKNVIIALVFTIISVILIFLHFIIISFIFQWADWVATLVFSFLFIIPGYFSNAGMVIVGGGKPIDRGRNWKDGRRILGDHKTLAGFVKGPLYIGIPISLGVFLLFLVLWPSIQQVPIAGFALGIHDLYNNISSFQYYFIGGTFPIGFVMIIIRVIFCSYGAAVGDLAGSFLKRRFNIASGAPFWIVDQLDFALGSILFASIPALFFPGIYFPPDLNIIIFVLLLTPTVSLISNTVAYFTGLKDVPW
jgi:CDP-2,3-bis-(O-geranylgeranyl)-sn-glycerol synthase